MKLVSLRKVSEWHVNQWEGDLDDGRAFYASVKNDRLAVGLGQSYAQAMRGAVGHPYIERFLKRDDWDAPYYTSELLRYLTKCDFNTTLISADEVESLYAAHRR